LEPAKYLMISSLVGHDDEANNMTVVEFV